MKIKFESYSSINFTSLYTCILFQYYIKLDAQCFMHFILPDCLMGVAISKNLDLLHLQYPWNSVYPILVQ